MITIPTTIVLGAGASVPYGFDSGSALLERAREYSLDRLRALIEPYTGQGIRALHETLRLTADTSIDAMLEFRSDLTLAGKTVIASLLLEQERTAREGAFRRIGQGDDWFPLLYHALRPKKLESFTENKVRIITYNYDRFLEARLVSALAAQFKATEVACKEIVRELDILHIHGKLGSYLTADKHAVPFGGSDTDDEMVQFHEIRQATSGIKIIHESEADGEDDGIKKAKSYLSESNKVVFLGFGYAERNLARLDLRHVLPSRPHVYGSALHVTPEQQEHFIIPQFDTPRACIRKLPRQGDSSKLEFLAVSAYSTGVRSPSESWGLSSLYSSIHQ